MRKLLLSLVILSLNVTFVQSASAQNFNEAIESSLDILRSLFFDDDDEVESREQDSHIPLQITSSRQALADLMANPLIRESYLDLQHTQLAHPTERIFTNFLKNSSIGQQVMEYADTQRLLMTKGFSMMAGDEYFRLRRGVSDSYDQFDDLVVQTAVDLGIPVSALEKREIYIAAGNANAFTISASEDQLIVVLQSGILQKMNARELKSVIAHEMGHVLSQHVNKGIALELLLNLSGVLLGVDDFAGNNEDHMHLESIKPHFHPEGFELNHMSVNGMESGMGPGFGIVNQVLGMPPQLQQAFMKEFFETLVIVLQQTDAPPETLRYFYALNSALPGAQVTKIDPSEYIKHTVLARSALSRVFEKTSDNYGVTVVKNEVMASGLSKLFGLDLFENLERYKVFEALREQFVNHRARYSEEELSTTGTTRSHPKNIPRIIRTLDLPNYPSIVFANPFMRIVAIALEVGVEQKTAELQLDEIHASGAAGKDEYQDVLKSADEIVTNYIQARQESYKKVIDLILEVELEDRMGSVNPRLRNLFEYLIFEKMKKILEAKTLEDLADEAEGALASSIETSWTAFIERMEFREKVVNEFLSQLETRLEGQSRVGSLTQERVSEIKSYIRKFKEAGDDSTLIKLRLELDDAPWMRHRLPFVPCLEALK